MPAEDRISRTATVDITHTVEDVAITTGIDVESASAVEAEITEGGELRLTIAGKKDLHSTEHRLPPELREVGEEL